MTITVNINDQSVSVPDGATVLDAINASETYISQLCKDPDMPGHRGLPHLPGADRRDARLSRLLLRPGPRWDGCPDRYPGGAAHPVRRAGVDPGDAAALTPGPSP